MHRAVWPVLCCAKICGPFDVGAVDLSHQIIAAIAEPGATLSIRPEIATGNSIDVTEPVQPCSSAESSTSVREVDICGDITTISECNGMLSDGVGPYDASVDCAVRLSGYRGGRYTLSFEEFQTEAGVDVLSVHDGSSADAPVLGTFSGADLPPTFTSSGSDLYLRFTTNDIVQDGGFRVAFNCFGDPVEYWKPADVATQLRVGETVHTLPPSSLHAECLGNVLLSVQCCADAEADCANARVTSLRLPNAELRGTLPEAIGQL